MASALQRNALQPRNTASTNVTCDILFSWMDNSVGQSPCLLAVSLYASCFTSNWHLSPIGSGLNYGAPSLPRANFGTCSWAVYNLYGACTACQDIPDTNIPDWNDYTVNCGNYLTNDAFPSDKVILVNHTLLPSWAAVNPMTWMNEKFNVAQAQAIQDSHYPDIDLSIPTTTTHKSISVRAVIAGAVGGVIGAVLAAVAVFLYLRYRDNIHKHAVSNTSQKATRPASLVAPSYGPSPVSTAYSLISPTNPFLHTHLHRPQSAMTPMPVQQAMNGAGHATMNTPVVSLFSPTAPVNSNRQEERVGEPREFYGDDDDDGAWEYYRNNAANLDKGSWSISSIWRHIWFR